MCYIVLSSGIFGVGFCRIVNLKCAATSPPDSVNCHLNEVVLPIEHCSPVGPNLFRVFVIFSGHCIVTSWLLGEIDSPGEKIKVVVTRSLE